jgi:hypothetical protein
VQRPSSRSVAVYGTGSCRFGSASLKGSVNQLTALLPARRPTTYGIDGSIDQEGAHSHGDDGRRDGQFTVGIQVRADDPIGSTMRSSPSMFAKASRNPPSFSH